MAHLVTLAHRVSDINIRYRELHSLVLEFSWSRLMPSGAKGKNSDCRSHRQDLASLRSELRELEAVISGPGPFEPGSTIGVEFLATLKRYVAALGKVIDALSGICDRMCRDSRGLESYAEADSRHDRVAYDESIQRYKRLGQRLHYLFERL